MMYELCYFSNAQKEFTNADVKLLLQQATIANAANDITGLLVFDGRRFFQLLEGEKHSVEALYETISKDTRHTNVELYHSGNIEKRTFANWSMTYKRVNNTRKIIGELQWKQAEKMIDDFTSNHSLGCRIIKLGYDLHEGMI